MIKFKPSPFLILFLSLNSILIFCASREVDTGNKPSPNLKHTDGDTQLSAFDNFDLPTITNLTKNVIITDEKVSSDIDYIIPEKVQNKLNPIVESSAETSFVEDSDEQKSENL
jgi:hypothetical protein